MLRRLQFVFAASILLSLSQAQTLSLDRGTVVASDAKATHSFKVYVDGLDDAPALIGESTFNNGVLRFEPRYPLAPGMSYRAELHKSSGGPIVQVFEIPKTAVGEPTHLEAIYPSADTLPENLLRVYLHFSAPMSRGDSYSHITLIDDATDQRVELPFLELEQELWGPNGKRLTVLFDPGRIKRGLVPNVEEGLPLTPGRSYSLTVSSSWLDAQGEPLAETFEKRFTVTPSDFNSPMPPQWKVSAPAAGTTDPLVVAFDEIVDRALALRLIDVLSRRRTLVVGKASLTDHETRWSFTPKVPWRAGRYRLRVDGTLEDPSGNSVLRPFEVSPDQPQPPSIPSISYLSFEVR
jgi:hypothetical protein